MPNICNYEIHFTGKKDNCLKLLDFMQAQYLYDGFFSGKLKQPVTLDHPYVGKWLETDENDIPIDYVPTEHHIGYRVFSCEVIEAEGTEDNYVVYAYGGCAWSVAACMFDGCGYLADFAKEKNRLAISITEACKQLAITAEIISDEGGCAFTEHYLINASGEIELDGYYDYQEIYLEEVETYEEYARIKAEQEEEPEVSEEEFNKAKSLNDDYFIQTDAPYWDDNTIYNFMF